MTLDRPLAFVADDDPLLLSLIASTLTEAGIAVRTAADGAASLAGIEACRPDVVVLDVRMPSQTGVDVLRAVRDSDWGRDLPVLMLTGEGRLDRMLEARRIGASDYLMKPFQPDELVVRVRRLLTPEAA